MIEKIILDFLAEQLGEVYVCMEIPENPPKLFALIEKTGGGMREHIQSAMIVIQSYAPTLYKAAVLNELIKNAMLYKAPALDEICSVQLNSDYNFTDTRTKNYRYQAVYEIKYY